MMLKAQNQKLFMLRLSAIIIFEIKELEERLFVNWTAAQRSTKIF
jgi:hypothetical protein